MKRDFKKRITLVVLAIIGAMLAPATAHAQCTADWQPGDGLAGINGQVLCMTTWDPDGSGPLPPVLVAGGRFSAMNSTSINNLAVWDGATWSTLGGGTNGQVRALTVVPNGDLIVAGSFSLAGDVPANGIASWNGSIWSPFGPGLGEVVTLAVTHEGDLLAGGALFTTAEGTGYSLARWDGEQWRAVGEKFGPFGYVGGVLFNWPSVLSLAVMPNGDIIASGIFSTINNDNTTTVNGIARWDGTTWLRMGANNDWSNMGENHTGGPLAVMSNGDLVLGVGLYNVLVYRWDGTAWSPLGDAWEAGQITSMKVMSSGDLFVGIGGQVAHLYHWNGSGWSTPGTDLNGGVFSLAEIASGELIVSGGFSSAGSVPAKNIVRRNAGGGWHAMLDVSPTTDGPVNALITMPNGDVVAGGGFTVIENVQANPTNHIARWNGAAWLPLGSGLSGSTAAGYGTNVVALAVMPGGDLIVGGNFTVAGDVPANCIASWNGSVWSALGSGVSGGPVYTSVYALAVLPDGDLIVGGNFTNAGDVSDTRHVARWDGHAWSAMGAGLSGPNSTTEVRALTVTLDGDLIAGGKALIKPTGGSYGGVARWNGSTWLAVGKLFDTATALIELPNGDLLAGIASGYGGIDGVSNIVRWNGSVWSTVEGLSLVGSVSAIKKMPNGDLVFGGGFTNNGFNNIARWDGTTLSAFGSGLNGSTVPSYSTNVAALAVRSNGDLLVGGNFTTAGGWPSVNLARYGCPATTVTCCRGTTCLTVNSDACTGTVAGSHATIVSSCGPNNHIATCCYGDFDHSGSSTIDDIFIYLNAWFSNSPYAKVGGDGTATPTIDDIFLFLNAWFTGCS